MASVFLAGAQTIYPVLVCSNACYTNASIFRTNAAYVLVSSEGGLEKVSITNLPDEMQKRIGYNPAKAAAALAEERQQLAAYKARLAQETRKEQSQRKLQSVQIISVYNDFGKCKVSGIAPVYSTNIMYDIPDSVRNYLADYYQLIQDSTYGKYLEEKTEVIKSESKSLRVDPTTINTDGELVESKNSVVSLKKTYAVRLAEVKSHLVQNTTVLAYPLGYAHDGFPVWQCVGVIAPTVPQPEAGVSAADKIRDVGEKK